MQSIENWVIMNPSAARTSLAAINFMLCHALTRIHKVYNDPENAAKLRSPCFYDFFLITSILRQSIIIRSAAALRGEAFIDASFHALLIDSV